ncbi:MAG: TRAP transporter small permease [Hyphomicrobiaceae bacterium]
MAVILLVAGIAGVVAIGVLWRYGFSNSLSWTEEASKAMMLWMVFTGAPIALRFNDHIAIEIVPNLLPPRLRAALQVLITALVVAFLWILTRRSIDLTINSMSQIAVMLGDISMAWIIGAVPFGAAVMLLVAVQVLVERIVVLLGGEPRLDPFLRHRGAQMRESGTA